MLSPRTPLTMSKPKFKTRRGMSNSIIFAHSLAVSHLTSWASSLLANSSKMVVLSMTTTFKNNPLFTWCFAAVVARRSVRRRRTTYVVRIFYAASFLKNVVVDPKKIKHQPKKVKMSVLKHYKVDSDGKMKRLRHECPSPQCGPAVFVHCPLTIRSMY